MYATKHHTTANCQEISSFESGIKLCTKRDTVGKTLLATVKTNSSGCRHYLFFKLTSYNFTISYCEILEIHENSRAYICN